jgi:hypothetical protein
LKGLDFYEASEFDKPDVLIASIRIEAGKLVWTKGPELGPRLLSSVQTEASPDADPAGYLEEVWLYVRNPYLWAVKVQ